MKKRITGLLFFLLILFFWSGCDSGNKTNDDNEITEADGKTWIRFINNNDFSVSIFSDISRLVKIADAAPQSQSASIQTEPNSSGALFYPTYNIVIDDVSIPYQGEVIISRVDEGKTSSQPNTVIIPLLEELGAAELAKPVSNATYIKIQNASGSSLSLRQGSVELPLEGSTSTILNGGETGLFSVTPGPASGYSLMRNTTTKVDFPAGLTEFVSARLYSFRFNGSSLTLLTEKQLTLAQAFALSPPENINARTLPSGNIALGWDRVGTENSYKIYRAEESPVNFNFLASTNNTSYTDNTVVLGNTYYYRLSSVKNNLESEKSVNYVTIVAEQSNLSAPAGLNASAQSTDSILLSWNAVEDATAYTIYRGYDMGNINTYVVTTAGTSYLVYGLETNTDYYFTVSAVSEYSESLPSSPVYGSTLQVPAIQPPAGVSASALGTSSIQVSWYSVSGATGYRVYRSYSASGYYDFIGSASYSPYTDNGLSVGTAYYYKVSALKDWEESGLSAYTSATTQNSGGTIENPPTMPTGLMVNSVYSGSITLTWNSVSTATTYNVYRSNTQTGAAGKVATVTGTSYTNNVPAGASYFYTVAGENSSGESPKSNMAFAYAADHFSLSYYSGASLRSIAAGAKHYFRLEVTQGASYTIEWQDGNNQNTPGYFRVAAYQNNGTQIFARDGYGSSGGGGFTYPAVFTATASGFVTVEVHNDRSSSQNYQIYYY